MNNPEIWTIKMADHPQDDFVRLSAYKALDLQMAELMVENARLKAEVERLRLQVGTDAIDREHGMCCDSSAENARLKAEVERLISVSEAWKKRRLDKVEAECIKWSDYEKLKAEVERLRKAGDAMAEAMWYGDAERSIWVKKFAETDWKAAREGKQP